MQTAKMNFMRGYNMTGTVRFEGETASGRSVAVEVDSATITALAKALTYTSAPGHAIWHVEHPEHAMPCSGCELAQQAA